MEANGGQPTDAQISAPGQGKTKRSKFLATTKNILAKRVGYRCSNPKCRGLTTGPHSDPDRSLCFGEAAHIVAAVANGPRGDVSYTRSQLRSTDNGIWLCGNCHAKVDGDASNHTVEELKRWKEDAEAWAASEREKGAIPAEDKDQRDKLRDQLDALMIHEIRKWKIRFGITEQLERLSKIGLEGERYGFAVVLETIDRLEEMAANAIGDLTHEQGSSLKTLVTDLIRVYTHQFDNCCIISIISIGFDIAYDGMMHRQADKRCLQQGCEILRALHLSLTSNGRRLSRHVSDAMASAWEEIQFAAELNRERDTRYYCELMSRYADKPDTVDEEYVRGLDVPEIE